MNENLKINQVGINLVKKCEGLHKKCGKRNGEQLVKTYYCPSGVLTIGYGTTGSRLKPGLVITESTAEDWLREDMEYFEKAVKKLVKVELNENQFSALVSFAYNCGEGALGRSTALKRLNQGDYKGCVEALQWWNKGTYGVLQGLVKRRQLEGQLFMAPAENSNDRDSSDNDQGLSQVVEPIGDDDTHGSMTMIPATLEVLKTTPLKPQPILSKKLIKQGISLKSIKPGKYQIKGYAEKQGHYLVKWDDPRLPNNEEDYLFSGHVKLIIPEPEFLLTDVIEEWDTTVSKQNEAVAFLLKNTSKEAIELLQSKTPKKVLEKTKTIWSSPGPDTVNRNEVNIKVPFFSQLDNRYKPHVTCNVTCVAMCCSFFGVKPRQTKIQLEDEFFTFLEGKGWNRTYHSNLVKLFQEYGIQDTFKTDATWEEVKEHLRKGNPVIYSGTLTHGGHIIVIRGFSESKQCWYVNDPYGEWFSYGYNTKLTGDNLEYSYGLLSRKSMTGSPTTTWAHFPSKS